jgi:trk system potassium uptake protein TrkH
MTSRGDTVLMVAVRPLVVLKYLGQVLLVLAALSSVPLAVALALGEPEVALRLSVLVAVTFAASVPLSRLPTPRQIQWNEALCVTALAFLLTPLLMSFSLASYGISFIDAWFEAVSGITTTGLSTLDTLADRSPVFLFTRSWMQWYGGLGIAVLSVALIMRHHASSRRLLESAGETATAETARTHARRVFVVYLLLTLAGILLVWFLHGDAFTAIIHILAAVSTGGFSAFDDSLAGLPVVSRAALMLFSFLGAVALPLYYLALRKGLRTFRQDPELKALVAAILVASIALGLLLHGAGGLAWREALGHGLLLGASAQTTAGFSSLDVASLDPTAKLVLILSMMTGGCTGSTAGGIKVVRVLVLLRLLQLSLRRTAAPARAVMETRLGGERLEPDVVVSALLLGGLWVIVVTLSWLPFLLYGYDPMNALFEVVSATGTVGLSAGISAPDLEAPLKLVLGLDMLFGRVEIIALLVVLYPATWLGRRRRNP